MTVIRLFVALLLQVGQRNHFVNGSVHAIDVFSASLCIVGLTAAATLNEFGSFPNDLAGIQLVLFHHVIREHHREQGLVVSSAADDGHQFLGHGLAQFKRKVFCRCRFYG